MTSVNSRPLPNCARIKIKLTGEVPLELSNLASLEYLNMDDNDNDEFTNIKFDEKKKVQEYLATLRSKQNTGPTWGNKGQSPREIDDSHLTHLKVQHRNCLMRAAKAQNRLNDILEVLSPTQNATKKEATLESKESNRLTNTSSEALNLEKGTPQGNEAEQGWTIFSCLKNPRSSRTTTTTNGLALERDFPHIALNRGSVFLQNFHHPWERN